MAEIILNIYLVIEKGNVVSFKAKAYEQDGDDEDKINFLKTRAKVDYEHAFVFDAPFNRLGQFMSYRKFSKLEKQGMQYQLFEEIFEKLNAPQNPIVCVTPIVDGKIFSTD
jgi:hypothetical protein